MALTATQSKSMYQFFALAFNAAPGVTYMNQLDAALNSGMSVTQVVEAFTAKAEFTSTYPNFLSNAAFATKFINSNVGSYASDAAKAAAIADVTAALNAGWSRGKTITQVFTNINALSETDATWGTFVKVINNEVAYAQYYTETLLGGAEATPSLAALRAVIANVTPTTSITDAAIAAVLNPAPVPVAQTFTLTTGADTTGTLKGDAGTTSTAGNDTFNGDITTLNVGDSLNGGAGIDTLNFTGTTNVALPVANISGIEILNIRQTTAALASTDLSLVPGLTTVNLDRSNQAATFTNMPAGGSYGVVGNSSVTNTGALAVGYATGATVTAATLNFSNGTLGAQAVTLTGANLLSTTINSTGAANVTGAFVDAATSKALTINATTGLTLASIGDSAARTAITINATGDVVTGAVTSSAAVTAAITGAGKVTSDLNLVVAPTITVSGSGAVSIGTLNAASTTLTSTQTGGSLTATMNAVTTTKVTGGAGNDVITTGAVLTTGFADGGAGNDTLIIGANVAHVNTAALAAKYTNFETLRLQGTLDMALLPSITAVELTAGASVITNMTATQAAAVTAQGDLTTTTLTLATQSGTSDVLNLKMGTGLTTAAATNSGVLTITGFETLNLSTNAGPTATAVANKTSTVTGAIVDTSLTNVNLTGTAFVFTDIASSKAVAWNGSALIGDGNTTAASVKGLTVAGNAFAGSTITGSNFVDNFTIGAVGSTYNAGAGDDLVISTQAVFAGSIVDGGAGTKDVARITDTAATTATLTINDNTFGGLTGFETIDFSGAVAGDFLWTLGGYANAIAAANGGAITATATALATAVTGDIITVDASGLAGTNALKLTMTNTGLAAAAVTAATTITGSNGADTIVYSEAGVAGGNNQRTIAISGGTGNDTITVSSVAVGAITIDGGSGNDTITGSAQIDTITGGTGADTMTGNGGVDTFIFAANGSVAGTAMDIITDMAATDILQFGAGTLVLLGADATALVAGTNVQQSAGGLVTFAAADNTLALKIAAIQADTQLDAAQSVAFFVDSGNTYVYYSGAAVGNTDDQIVQLTGVTALATITVGGASTSSMVIA